MITEIAANSRLLLLWTMETSHKLHQDLKKTGQMEKLSKSRQKFIQYEKGIEKV